MSDVAALTLLVMLAVVLDLPGIGEQALWHDEVFSVQAAQLGWHGLAALAMTPEINMIFYYVLLKIWLVLGDSDAWVRSLSALFAVASVGAIHRLGTEMFSRRVGVIAALLLSLNAFVIHYSEEARTYTLVLFLAVFSTFLLLRALRSGRRLTWAAYSIAAAAMAYSHVLALTILLVQAAAALTYRSRPPLRVLVVVAAVVGVLTAPLMLISLTTASAAVVWVPPTTISGILYAWQELTGTVRDGPLGWIGGGLAIFYAVLIAVAVAAQSAARNRWLVGFLLVWMIVPVAIIVAISAFKPIFVVRYLVIVVPALTLLAAVGINSLPLRLALLGSTVLVVILAANAVIGWRSHYMKPDWRSVTAYLLQSTTPHDRTIFVGDWGRPVNYYAEQMGRGGDIPLKLWRGLDPSSADFPANLAAIGREMAADQRVLWVIIAGDKTSAVTSDPRFSGLLNSYRIDHVSQFQLVTISQLQPLARSTPS